VRPRKVEEDLAGTIQSIWVFAFNAKAQKMQKQTQPSQPLGE
jgi:hypothetical protein